MFAASALTSLLISPTIKISVLSIERFSGLETDARSVDDRFFRFLRSMLPIPRRCPSLKVGLDTLDPNLEEGLSSRLPLVRSLLSLRGDRDGEPRIGESMG